MSGTLGIPPGGGLLRRPQAQAFSPRLRFAGRSVGREKTASLGLGKPPQTREDAGFLLGPGTHTVPDTHTYTHSLTHTHSHTHMHSHTHIHTLIHAHTHTHTLTCTLIHIYTHTCTHSHTFTHTLTHTHSHQFQELLCRGALSSHTNKF